MLKHNFNEHLLYSEIINNCTVHVSHVLAQSNIIITLHDCVNRT